MDGFCIELTNACSRRCLHCFRNKTDPPEFLPLPLAREVLPQAKALGFRTVCLTGGEVALYPDLEEFLSLLVDHGFSFTLVTNGYRFRENLLPLLSAPKNREKLTAVCFSLDGAGADTHDALRGPGSFAEVMDGASLCQLAGLPLCFKSVITNCNKEELTGIALLGAGFDPLDHGFIHPFPSPRMLEAGVIPSPDELRKIMDWIAGSLRKAVRPKIIIEGYGARTTLFACPNIMKNTTMDFQGNLLLCCNLSHVTREEGQPSVFGREWLGNLTEMSLREGLIRHYHGVARLMEARLRDMEELDDLTLIPCYWCLQHFGKLDWLRDYPESPWFNGVIEEKRSHAGA